MKNYFKFAVVLFFSIFFAPQICGAFYQDNTPIPVIIVETAASKAAALKATYGVVKYYDCRSEYSNSFCDFVHGSDDPSSQMTCEQMIGYCLERNAIRVNDGPSQLDSRCVTKYGANSRSIGKDSSGVNICDCKEGYYLDYFNKCSQGIPKNVAQGALNLMNGVTSDPKANQPVVKTSCDNDYVLISGECMTRDKVCKTAYGQFSYWTNKNDENDKALCDCTAGYIWNPGNTACIQSTVKTNLIKEPKIDLAFAKKQVGKILLQVESRGEAWYVNPKDGKMHYMADGNSAYDVMRNLGVGITNKDLDKIQTNKTFAKKNAGKIFLQVEASGEAYYIDFNGVAHYLKDGAAAYEVMRSLGLGITNDNLNKIPEGGL